MKKLVFNLMIASCILTLVSCGKGITLETGTSNPDSTDNKKTTPKNSYISKATYNNLTFFDHPLHIDNNTYYIGAFKTKSSLNTEKDVYKIIIIKTDKNRNIDTSWGEAGTSISNYELNSEPTDVISNSTGELFILFYNRITKGLVNGELDNSFGNNGTLALNFERGRNYFNFNKIRLNQNGDFLISVLLLKPRSQVFDHYYAILMFDNSGNKVKSFAKNGLYEKRVSFRQDIFDFEILPSDQIVYSGKYQRLSWGGSDDYTTGVMCLLKPDGLYEDTFSSYSGIKTYSPFLPLNRGLLINEDEIKGIVGFDHQDILKRTSLNIYLNSNQNQRHNTPDFSIPLFELGDKISAQFFDKNIIITSNIDNGIQINRIETSSGETSASTVSIPYNLNQYQIYKQTSGLSLIGVISSELAKNAKNFKWTLIKL